MEEEKVLEEVKPEELETIEVDEEVEVELGGDNAEELPKEPQTQMEEENYEVGDTNIQEE